MRKKTLEKLIQDLEQEMLRLGYTEGTMKFYRRRWRMLRQFAQEQGESYYSERLGIDFVEKFFQVFNQSKTRETISLPLIPEVGWAVIDYLKYGRPQIDSPYLFVRHIAPFGPFSKDDHLNQLIKRYMELAHLPTLKKRRGMHSLRHTMASMLLEKETPLSTISDILGHVDTDSTAVYLKVDINKLKECSLDFEEVTIHE